MPSRAFNAAARNEGAGQSLSAWLNFEPSFGAVALGFVGAAVSVSRTGGDGESTVGGSSSSSSNTSEPESTSSNTPCDPPAFAPSKQSADAGLRAYERVARLAAPLVSDGGYLVLCSCSHAADLTKFRNACSRGIGRAGRRGQIIYTGYAGPDHPQLPHLAESGYLKVLVYRL